MEREASKDMVRPAVEADGKKKDNANGGEREVEKVELGAPVILSAPFKYFKSIQFQTGLNVYWQFNCNITYILLQLINICKNPRLDRYII